MCPLLKDVQILCGLKGEITIILFIFENFYIINFNKNYRNVRQIDSLPNFISISVKRTFNITSQISKL